MNFPHKNFLFRLRGRILSYFYRGFTVSILSLNMIIRIDFLKLDSIFAKLVSADSYQAGRLPQGLMKEEYKSFSCFPSRKCRMVHNIPLPLLILLLVIYIWSCHDKFSSIQIPRYLVNSFCASFSVPRRILYFFVLLLAILIK